MTHVARPGSSLVAFWAAVGIAVVFLGDAVAKGEWVFLAEAIAPTFLVVWGVWIFLTRSRIAFDEGRVVVTNALRVHEVPWQRVTDIRMRLQLLIELDDGSTLTCWGSPFPEKPGRRRPDPTSRRRVGGEFAGPLIAIWAAADSAKSQKSAGPVVRRWDRVPTTLGGVAIFACLVELVIIH